MNDAQSGGYNAQGVPQQPMMVPYQNRTNWIYNKFINIQWLYIVFYLAQMQGWGFSNQNIPNFGFGSAWVNTPGYDRNRYEGPPMNNYNSY